MTKEEIRKTSSETGKKIEILCYEVAKSLMKLLSAVMWTFKICLMNLIF